MPTIAGLVAVLGGVSGVAVILGWLLFVQNSIQSNPLIIWLQSLPVYDWMFLLVALVVLAMIALRPKPRRRRR